jgi:hypothetical protein
MVRINFETPFLETYSLSHSLKCGVNGPLMVAPGNVLFFCSVSLESMDSEALDEIIKQMRIKKRNELLRRNCIMIFLYY